MEWLIPGVLIALALFVIAIYNRLVTGRNRYKNAFAQIDVQLTRRHELIPNLVEVAKRYMSHEQDTLEAVIQARNAATNQLQATSADPTDPSAMKKLGKAEQGLSAGLGRLFALSENYPDLKANQNMMQLTEELTSTENKVAFARQAFNDAVMNYNILRETFPNNLIAGMFNFQEAELFEIDEPEKRQAVAVDFS